MNVLNSHLPPKDIVLAYPPNPFDKKRDLSEETKKTVRDMFDPKDFDWL